MITILSGGVGGAKFAAGVQAAVSEEEELVVIVNTADDEEFYGLHVSPDIDTVTYTLAGLGDWDRGWGIKEDTFNCNEMLGRLDLENWFKIGDKDLALNLLRTKLLRKGYRLSQVTERIRKALEIRARILPMTDDPIRTMVETEIGVLRFQEYFVKHGYRFEAKRIWFEGLEKAEPLPEAIHAVHESDIIAIAPSNPIVSIGPILGLKGFRDALRKSSATKIAISPLIGGKTIKGPADKMLQMLGVEPTSYGVYTLYRDIIDTMIIDLEDRELASKIEAEGKQCLVLATRMNTRQDSQRLASQILTRIRKLS
ncbi:MAG: 2-phospho-L-lactate transferase [Nitrososphaerota archaeon]